MPASSPICKFDWIIFAYLAKHNLTCIFYVSHMCCQHAFEFTICISRPSWFLFFIWLENTLQLYAELKELKYVLVGGNLFLIIRKIYCSGLINWKLFLKDRYFRGLPIGNKYTSSLSMTHTSNTCDFFGLNDGDFENFKWLFVIAKP